MSHESSSAPVASPELTAFYRPPRPAMQIAPASRWREWMNDTTLRFANRCLPLLMANESGWVLLNEHPLTATWDGSPHTSGLTVDYGERVQPERGRATSLFGYGVLTFEIPYLFRTSPGWDLLVRGPANWPLDGIQALEGLVETDWAVATFTMNWKFTRPGTVEFAAGDPVAMVVPQPRTSLEGVDPTIRSVESDPDTEAGWDAFRASRHEVMVRKFIADFVPGMDADRNGWERDYFRGERPDGKDAPEHRTKRRLKPFVVADES